MLKSTIQVTLFSIIGIVINFIIQLVLAYYFGASQDRDAYFAAITIPAYIALLFTGSIGMLLVPHLIKNSIPSPGHIKQDITSPLINFTSIILILIAVVASLLAYPIVTLIVPKNKPELFQSTVYLFRIMMFSMVFTVLNNMLASAFQSRHSFFIPSISIIITNFCSLVAVTTLSSFIGISSIAYGALTGGALSFVYLVFCLNRKYSFIWGKSFFSPELKMLMHASLPLFAAGLIFRTSTIFERYFAARLPEGSLSYLGNGNQIVMILSTIVSTGIATTSFPLLSRYWTENNMYELQKTFVKVLNIILMIVFPMIVMFIACGKDVIGLLFEHGAFTSSDTTALFYTLAGLMGYFLFSSMGNVVARLLYISNHTRVAAIIAVSELVVYLGAAVLLVKPYGFIGLALSLSISAAFNVFISLLYINSALIRTNLTAFTKRTSLLLIISLIILLLLFLLDKYMPAVSGSLLRVGVTVILSIALYWITFAVILKDEYYMSLIQLIRNKIKTNG